ncbi:MAG: hypothetical protein ABWY48_09040 [Pseudoxanthomonas sp.]
MTDGDQRPRFLPPTQEMIDAHLAYREHAIGAAAGARAFGPGFEAKPTFEVSFAACSKDESAWESQGQGEFTVRATAILAEGFDKLTNAGFIERVRAEFGAGARQHVQLDSSHRGAAKRMLLQPLTGAAGAPAAQAKKADVGTTADLGQLVDLLQKIEQLLQQGQPQLSRARVRERLNGGVQVPPPQSLQSAGEQNR